MKFFKKYHKWIGIIITLFLLLFAVSGIVLNHRQLFSSVDVSRKYLPEKYRFKNWNLAAVKAVEKIGIDSNLVYGNIGLWLTDSTFTNYTDFSKGIPKGIDNRKISKIYKTKRGNLFAASLFGLYKLDSLKQKWRQIDLPLHNPRIVYITEKGDSLLVLSRSFLFTSIDDKTFKKHQLPNAEGHADNVSLFKTLWIIHSGELFGTAGKLVVDAIAVIFIFLCITGLILFINPKLAKRARKKHHDNAKFKKSTKWNLKWHNKIGWTTLVFLLITTITGMFLRPPLLIAIASSKVDKIPHTTLDNQNPWFDKLRVIHYNEQTDSYILGTSDGMFYSKDIFSSKIYPFKKRVPVSVMGINVFEQKSADEFLVGSFEGLFLWNTKTEEVFDYIGKKPYVAPKRMGPPIGRNLVAGYVSDYEGNECFFDYSKGFSTIDKSNLFLKMPDNLQKQPISLWNLMLEVHTARIYESLFGKFYILIVPLVGLLTIFVLISGFIVWFRMYKNKKH